MKTVQFLIGIVISFAFYRLSEGVFYDDDSSTEEGVLQSSGSLQSTNHEPEEEAAPSSYQTKTPSKPGKGKLGITYGKPIPFTDYATSYVRIWVKKANSTHFCSGSLIQHNRVLSAAHCFPGAKMLYVCVGSPKCLTSAGKCIYVDPADAVLIHKGYSEAVRHNQMWDDIAVIVLTQSLLTPDTQILELCRSPTREANRFEGQSSIVMGCGQTHNQSLSDTLLYINQLVVPQDDGLNTFSSLKPYKDRYKIMFTVSPNDFRESSCNGDSGAALIFYNPTYSFHTNCGVLSFGGVKCTTGSPSAYTRTEEYAGLILKGQDGIPLREFELLYAPYAGRSSKLYKSLGIDTEVDELGLDFEWQDDSDNSLSSRTAQGANDVLEDDAAEGDSPTEKINRVVKKKSKEKCSFRDLLRALCKILSCDESSEEDEE